MFAVIKSFAYKHIPLHNTSSWKLHHNRTSTLSNTCSWVQWNHYLATNKTPCIRSARSGSDPTQTQVKNFRRCKLLSFSQSATKWFELHLSPLLKQCSRQDNRGSSCRCSYGGVARIRSKYVNIYYDFRSARRGQQPLSGYTHLSLLSAILNPTHKAGKHE